MTEIATMTIVMSLLAFSAEISVVENASICKHKAIEFYEALCKSHK